MDRDRPHTPTARARVPTPGTARRSLLHATGFVRAQAAEPWLEQPWSTWQRQVRTRLLGNWLGELDRLLRGLVDDTLLDRGAPIAPLQRDTGRKLLMLRDDAGVHQPRLHGMSRAWATYRFTAGTVTRPDVRGGSAMTVGWSNGDGTDLRRFAIGEPLRLGGAGLEEVCDFYEELAHAVVATPGAPARPVSGPARPRATPRR